MSLCGLVLAPLGFRLFRAAPFHLPLELPPSLQNQVIVVAHEAKGMNLPLGLLARLGQGLGEVVPVHAVEEDVFTLTEREPGFDRVRDLLRAAKRGEAARVVTT